MSTVASYDAAIGLGANLGDPLETIREACRHLGRLGRLAGASALYRTAAIGPPQPDFVNAVVGLRCGMPPRSLMTSLLEIEAQLGRVRRERWGARTIDLDLLWIDGVVVNSQMLCVPHPRLEQRRFALAPLLDVYPRACHPITGRPYATLLHQVSDQQARRIANHHWLGSAQRYPYGVNAPEASEAGELWR